jgi:hypothetical protein
MSVRAGVASVVGAVAVVVAVLFATLDAPTAGFFAFAVVLVTGLGAAPVVFGVVTRARDRRYNESVDEEDGPRR